MRVDNVFTVSHDGGRDVNASTKSGTMATNLWSLIGGVGGVTRDPGCIKLPKTSSLLSF